MAASQISHLLSLEATIASTSLSRSSIYALMEVGEFPAPVRVSARRVAWNSAAVQAWIDSRPTATAWSRGGASHV
ncbi:MAG: hypothetical protein B7Y51_09225 [Burkholderiales bacterium 28-67-8]|nr:MAG: hypothetical protein B7Y51_09225 [Burkholderiales bacterium 28-67-8]